MSSRVTYDLAVATLIDSCAAISVLDRPLPMSSVRSSFSPKATATLVNRLPPRVAITV
ncbi:hypothetical protein [Micromonospora sp. CPCC 205556]|uniref:hypothetical protein n=1 Tax=Micromonospora sp. CPCC 205556 TaxID=3122398 RepID=UPI003FA5E452